MGAVAKRYAKALFEVAKEREELDKIEQDLQYTDQVLREHPDLVRFLTHPLVKKETKKELIGTVFAEQLSPTTLSLLRLLVDRERENELSGIATYFVRLANEVRGLVDVVVTTATPLLPEKQEVLRQQLARMTGKKVRLHFVVDEGVLGGITVKIGDLIYDGTVRGKLSRFERLIATTKS
ncbi:ATP synthase F1, delta subunit [Caldalkalibacillus thermarum TA2.A1]|uniref:ATP synthase subunit delta n=2 Tax=Bacillaceae TaxID=186817 RepID=F5LA75_CALTT|nr:F0F1 ATP synthase subunit delta [Caldalkalibacillus thermarum]AAQ10087.1 ATP synthase subunit delta [Bacillus sp. TA2.A1]EGL81795.1 ATP synthase F1, delta subunit [Caldalkalibacillus thermarum TA2.A1]QZT34169.1 F0F1 ATP synthase subunit delta [Caldalkalibacillus thermarum TA2.A1]